MKARAPGKLVLSGSYSVLWGAPAVVTAVSRSAHADSARAAVHVAEEVAAAVRLGFLPAPCFVDADELRAAEPGGGSRKLGLGSSAAILLASLVAHRGAPADDAGRAQLFRDALAAHRLAQGGGSGIDVAASTLGGTLRFELPVLQGGRPDPERTPEVLGVSLPPLRLVVFAAKTPAVTQSFVARVRELEAREPLKFMSLMSLASGGAEAFVRASDTHELCAALRVQRDALAQLGDAAGVPIVTSEVRELAALAAAQGAFFGPSGAGGGDVAFFAGDCEPSGELVSRAAALGYERLALTHGSPGAEQSS